MDQSALTYVCTTQKVQSDEKRKKPVLSKWTSTRWGQGRYIAHGPQQSRGSYTALAADRCLMLHLRKPVKTPVLYPTTHGESKHWRDIPNSLRSLTYTHRLNRSAALFSFPGPSMYFLTRTFAGSPCSLCTQRFSTAILQLRTRPWSKIASQPRCNVTLCAVVLFTRAMFFLKTPQYCFRMVARF